MAVSDAQNGDHLPVVLSRVSELVDSKPQSFLAGDETTYAAALEATKYVFDLSLQREKYARPPIAQLVRSIEPSTRPETRSQRKRKRSLSPLPTPPPQADEEIWRPTPLESLHLEGMDDDQVWAQLELRAAALCETLKVVFEEDEEAKESIDGTGMEDGDLEDFDLEDLEYGSEVLDDSQDEEDIDDDEMDEEEDGEVEGLDEEITELRDPSDESSGDEMLDLDRPTRPSLRKRKDQGEILPGRQRGGHPVLDDGFFSLAEFNAETDEAESRDVTKGRLGEDEDDDDDVAEDDVDLFATVDAVGAETFEEDDLEDGGEPYYKDFFAPPSRKSHPTGKTKAQAPIKADKTSKVRFHDEVRVKKIKSRGKGHSVASMKNGMMLEDDEDDEDDVFGLGEEFDDEDGVLDDEFDSMDDDDEPEMSDLEEEEIHSGGGVGSRETIERLKDDLFAEDEEAPQDISTHEARQAEIAAQIMELEAKSVAPKEWTLMGEATSRSRPVNSLLEEDLDFERVMKAVPVVTEERVNSLEEIIKKRILGNNFDDVIRKRPIDDKPFLPSRFFELNDQKSAKSLTQIYEDEYSAAASGTGVDDRDGKLKKEHEELENMWDSICHKLDALSNAHFTPKEPKAKISTVANLPTTTLESAIPTTKSTTTMLAPEEIFAAPSEVRSHDELTPVEKRAQRNKQRKARRRTKDVIAASVDKFARTHKAKGSAGNVKKEKEKALKNVIKTGKGVTVVGKKGAESKQRNKGDTIAAMPVDGKKYKL